VLSICQIAQVANVLDPLSAHDRRVAPLAPAALLQAAGSLR
jgi:hypothetical protein